MTLTYGINVTRGASIGGVPIKADAELPMLIGAHPVDQVGEADETGSSLTLKLVNNWDEYVTYFGDEDYWGADSLTRADGWNFHQVAKYWLQDRNIYPIIIYNAFDPASHMASVSAESLAFTAMEEEIDLSYNYVDMNSIVISGKVLDTDYSLARNDDGGVTVTSKTITATVSVAYDYCDPTAITSNNMVAAIGKVEDIPYTTGFGPNKIPGWIHAPMWSYNHANKAAVRSKLQSVANSIDQMYVCKAIYDLTEDGTSGTPINEKAASIKDPQVLACAGAVAIDEVTYPLSDLYIADQIQTTDEYGRGFPCETASYKYLLGNGSGIPTHAYTITESNAIRDAGIVTVALDRGGQGWRIYGANTSYFNGTNRDVAKDSYVQMAVYSYLNNVLINDTWELAMDKGITQARIEMVLNRWNLFLKGLVRKNLLIGGEIQFNEADNDDITSLVVFRIILLAPVTMQRLDFVVQVDLNYLSTLFS